jgi:hypothetical protein
VSAASQYVNPKFEVSLLSVSKELYQMCPKLCGACIFVVSGIVNCTRMCCIEIFG